MVRRLERERMPWMLPLASLIEAAVENASGRRQAAIASLRTAVDVSEAAEMAMHGIIARYRLGELLGGDEGRKLVESARLSLSAEGIKNPERWVAAFLPGAWNPG
jgi:hypothetical protein